MRTLFSCFAALALVSPGAFADEFTLEDLRALVAEFETVVPHNAAYTYPIEISIVESEEVNAGAGLRLDGEALQAILQVNTGFIEAVDGDPACMRAVVAHEMAHLALGHAIENSDMGDLDQALTRQEELAADAAGVTYLEALGHSKDEMVKLLEFLDTTLPRGFPIWLGTVGSDHSSPITRAGLIAGDSTVLAALARLETGAAFMECRRYEEAILWFEAALAIEPRMAEARVNIALASLQDYYERLPIKVQEEWLQPAFISHLTTSSLLGGRAVEVTDKDLARYERVLERIREIPEGFFGLTQAFLLGTLEVLHPKGDKQTIEAGVERLRANQIQFPEVMAYEFQVDQLRFANNVAVGLARLGKMKEAQDYLVSQSLKTASVFVREAGENMGRLPFGTLDEAHAVQALNSMITYVMVTPPDAPNFAEVKSSMQALLKSLKRELRGELSTQDMYLCQAVGMRVDGDELLLFDPVTKYLLALGEPSGAGFLLEKYPDLVCYLFGAPDVVLLAERGQVLKITSYRPGSSIELKPTNSTSRELRRITVGMPASELEAMLATTGAQSANVQTFLFGRSMFIENADTENWDYYPELNLGVLIVDGKVAGISVTPVKR